MIETLRSTLVRRAVGVHMRGGMTVDGNVHVGERQSLIAYLATRGFFLNLTEARVHGASDWLEHLAIRTDLVLWAKTHDDEMPLSASVMPTLEPRWAEITLDGGPVLHAGLHIAPDQRMTDCIDGRTGFLPASAAALVESRDLLGPVAINMNLALMVREISTP